MGVSRYSIYEIRIRAVQAVLQGLSMPIVAKAYQVNRSTVLRWVERYENEGCNDGLIRKPVSGRPRLFAEISDRKLLSIVLKPASSLGYETDFWTCGRLCHVFRKTFGIKSSKWTIWRWLRDVGLTYQKPQRQYFEASEKDRKEWLKKELPKIRRTVKKHNAILYFEDEANISLTALLGKTWSLRGKTPVQKVTGKRGGVSAMSAISKKGNLIFTLHEKKIASAEIIHFLAQMLKHHQRRHLVVVMDKAPPHTSKKTQNFIENQKRLHVFYLPSYSPDWNPDEQVWNHLKHQELKNHQAKTKKETKKLARKKLSEMSKDPKKMRGIFFRCYVAEFFK
jgi:transposase